MKLPKLPKLPKFGRGKAKAAADEEVDDLAGLLDDDDNDAAAADDAEDDAPPARPARPAVRSPAADDNDGDTGDDTGLKDPDGDEPDLDAGADDAAPPERGGNDDDDDFVPDDPDDNDDGNFASSFDDEDEAARPAWRNPILLSSVGVAVLLGIGLAWLAASFDWEGYQQSTQPRMQVAALPPALPAGAVPAAAAPAATQAPAAAVGAPAPAATQGAATPATPAATPPAAIPPGARAPTATPATAPAAVPAAPAVAVALAAVPDPALVAPGADGPLPVIAPDGRQAWNVYARPFTAPAGTSKIAIVVGGLGLSQAATRAAIQQLPGVVTLAFAPNAPNLQDWIAEARAAGHEVVLQLPMEPEGFPANDPGPYTLLANATAADNLERLHWLLSRFTGYVGVTNYLGTKLSTQADALKPILADLRERGLLFLDSRETNDSVAGKVAAELKLPRVINNRFIDASASRTGVDQKLAELERIATATGTAVGIGYPYPVTIERVTEWAKSLPGKNIVLAPVSAVAAVDPVN